MQSLVKPSEHGTLNDAAVADLGLTADRLAAASGLAEVLQLVRLL